MIMHGGGEREIVVEIGMCDNAWWWRMECVMIKEPLLGGGEWNVCS